MKLIILGSGTAVIRKKRKSACYLLDAGKKLLLFDCGTGVVNIINTKYDPQKIDHILISHPHADHFGNLINVLQSIYVSGLYYPNTRRSKILYLHGYKGFIKDYENIRKIIFPERNEPYQIKLFETRTAKKFEELTIKSGNVKHNPKFFHASCYRIQVQKKIFVYGGDCSFDKNLIEMSKDADLALYEMAISPKKFKKSGPAQNHLSPYECGLIALQAGVKKLALVHWYDDSSKNVIMRDVRKNFQGPVLIPEDLDEIYF